MQDGYAVVSSDGPGEYVVVGESRAGHMDDIQLTPGHVAYITTGTPTFSGSQYLSFKFYPSKKESCNQMCNCSLLGKIMQDRWPGIFSCHNSSRTPGHCSLYQRPVLAPAFASRWHVSQPMVGPPQPSLVLLVLDGLSLWLVLFCALCCDVLVHPLKPLLLLLLLLQVPRCLLLQMQSCK
jgi:hypothetical protein